MLKKMFKRLKRNATYDKQTRELLDMTTAYWQECERKIREESVDA